MSSFPSVFEALDLWGISVQHHLKELSNFDPFWTHYSGSASLSDLKYLTLWRLCPWVAEEEK